MDIHLSQASASWSFQSPQRCEDRPSIQWERAPLPARPVWTGQRFPEHISVICYFVYLSHHVCDAFVC